MLATLPTSKTHPPQHNPSPALAVSSSHRYPVQIMLQWESVHVEVTVWILDAVIHLVMSWESVPGSAV